MLAFRVLRMGEEGREGWMMVMMMTITIIVLRMSVGDIGMYITLGILRNDIYVGHSGRHLEVGIIYVGYRLCTW